MNPIRITIFDDNKRIRESLSMLIEITEDFILAGCYENVLSVNENINGSKPNVILMDIDMPGRNGIEAVKLVHESYPEIPIMMLTIFEDSDKVFQSLCAGAVGYLLKNTPPQKLIEAIREVNEGGAPMTPSIARKVMQHFQSQNAASFIKEEYNLSEREKEVLKLLVEGFPYKLIADKLNIAYETVRSHMKHIYEKLHVTSMTEAVAKAIQQKMFS